MDDKKQAISSDLQTQWQDHFHMRDQTWKMLKYSILFFIGVVGLEIKEVDEIILIFSYFAVLLTSLFGVFISHHHRQRQKEKFQIIVKYEKELGLYELIEPILTNANKSLVSRFNTSNFIIVMQLSIAIVAAMMLAHKFFQ
jgi:hypothetical protein